MQDTRNTMLLSNDICEFRDVLKCNGNAFT